MTHCMKFPNSATKHIHTHTSLCFDKRMIYATQSIKINHRNKFHTAALYRCQHFFNTQLIYISVCHSGDRSDNLYLSFLNYNIDTNFEQYIYSQIVTTLIKHCKFETKGLFSTKRHQIYQKYEKIFQIYLVILVFIV